MKHRQDRQYEILEIQIDAGLKQRAGAVFQKFGLSHSQAIELFLKAVVREKSLPFEFDRATPPNPDWKKR
ncbi:MAG: type II toxin-antitoxin system RelB/DinJ family antitoxin [Magnetococcales bacterium]|nr:type II toxin-antitoxin system RelB/DinJ family antitoxin [Magnetococcales bacterium]